MGYLSYTVTSRHSERSKPEGRTQESGAPNFGITDLGTWTIDYRPGPQMGAEVADAMRD